MFKVTTCCAPVISSCFPLLSVRTNIPRPNLLAEILSFLATSLSGVPVNEVFVLLHVEHESESKLWSRHGADSLSAHTVRISVQGSVEGETVAVRGSVERVKVAEITKLETFSNVKIIHIF
jgi:hypothetical protein